MLRTPRNVALYRDLLRGAVGLLVVLGIVLAILYLAAMSRVLLKLQLNDFGKFYYSARLFLDGQDMYGPSPATAIPVNVDGTSRQFWNMNPPHFHLLVLPLAPLSPINALAVWIVMNLAALLWSVRMVVRELELRMTFSGVLWGLLAFLCCSATCAIVITGQITFLLVLPFTYAWAMARRGQWTRAGIALGVLISVKPFLGVFGIYLLLLRQFRAAVWSAISGAAAVLAGLLVFGPDTYLAWSRAVKSIEWLWAPMNGSIHGLFSRTFSPSPLFPGAFSVPAVIVPLATLSCLAVLAVTYARLSRSTEAHAVDYSFGLLLLTALLVTPLGWVYYWWLLAGPLAALWRAHTGETKQRTAWLLMIALPGLVYPPLFVSRLGALAWVPSTIGSVYLWTTLVLWFLLVRRRDVA